MDELDIEHRLTEVESRSKSNVKRLDKLEPVVDEIHNMSNTMVQILETIKHTNENVSNLNEKMDKIDSRVDVIERTPGKEWSNTKRTFFNAMLGAIGSALAIGLIMLIAQYI